MCHKDKKQLLESNDHVLRVCLSVCISSILMNLTDSNNMLYFFTMYNYLNELHCSQKYYIGINSNLFIKNYINYIHICTFIYVNLIMFILREKCRWYIFIQAYIDLYRSLLLLFQKLFYRGKKKLYSSQQYFCRLIYKDSPSTGF